MISMLFDRNFTHSFKRSQSPQSLVRIVNCSLSALRKINFELSYTHSPVAYACTLIVLSLIGFEKHQKPGEVFYQDLAPSTATLDARYTKHELTLQIDSNRFLNAQPANSTSTTTRLEAWTNASSFPVFFVFAILLFCFLFLFSANYLFIFLVRVINSSDCDRENEWFTLFHDIFSYCDVPYVKKG